MKLVLFPEHTCVVFEIHAETDVEKALLNHLAYEHQAIVCNGGYRLEEGKLRLVIKNPQTQLSSPERKRRKRRG